MTSGIGLDYRNFHTSIMVINRTIKLGTKAPIISTVIN